MKDWLDCIRDLSPRERALFAVCLVLWPLFAGIELMVWAVSWPCFWLAGRLSRHRRGQL